MLAQESARGDPQATPPWPVLAFAELGADLPRVKRIHQTGQDLAHLYAGFDAALAAAGFDSEENLMSRVRDALAELRRTAKQTRCLDYVLDSPTWNCKGNFFCYLHDRNENTIVDPAVIYFDFSNPFYKEKA